MGRPWEVVAMRVLSMLGTVLACGATALSAQRSHRIELGGVGSSTPQAPPFRLDQPFRCGGRLGFFLNNNIPGARDGCCTPPSPPRPGPTTPAPSGTPC